MDGISMTILRSIRQTNIEKGDINDGNDDGKPRPPKLKKKKYLKSLSTKDLTKKNNIFITM